MKWIGVTGHRFLAEVDRLGQGIDLGLDWIEQTFPQQPWSVLSSIAEGADRLVLERVRARRPESRLVVPLPLSVQEYLEDFETPASKAEFTRLLASAAQVIPPPTGQTRNEGYAAAGNYVIEHCDILITLWDGQDAQGQGGTGEMVQRARQRGIPVVWVKCGNRKPGTREPLSLGKEQGDLLIEALALGE